MTEALLSEKASLELVRGALALAREMAKDEIERLNKKPLRQGEIMELYGFDHKYMKYLKSCGLRSRRQGKSVYYDVRDVDEILEKLKE
ncbi:hypothetical protein HO757_02560 [Streptococcus suis]|uniref:Pathogenicity island protein n=1 Tax=Streptococcus suis TaxID=1307 RepID=A0A0Z8QW01_STRSU|nr:hypothetical protein [Streptococcus suis]NQP75433.1 hypothetical protein [Streptococcus suis]NQP77461.1 hypothetical protein [Streptococcus suis]NQP91802.1 hypothetical protein [Streptococcus suis]NQP93758.1 hypothetical protein [Streptococcus suis]NQS63261.1 hypothetical protein [Streptococcus suis]